MDLHEVINAKAKALWEKYAAAEQIETMPMFYPKLKSGAILFVGLNPSFSGKGDFYLKESDIGEKSIQEVFRWAQISDEKILAATKAEYLFRSEYPYYSEFQRIAGELNSQWEHIDLFFYRETSQNELRQKLFQKVPDFKEDSLLIDNNFRPFFMDQLNLSIELMTELEPKLIVVVNALAANILYAKLGLKKTFDENSGAYSLVLKDGSCCPILLASMLSGQRAMDTFSKERLVWHMEKVLKGLS